MTAEVQPLVSDPAESGPTGFEAAATAETIRGLARRDPADALVALNEAVLRYAIELFDLPQSVGAASFSGWSRANPMDVGPDEEHTLRALSSGTRLLGRQPIEGTGASGRPVLVVVRDEGSDGDGRLIELADGAHLRSDEPIFDRPGFRQRWVEIEQALEVEPIAHLPAARLQPALDRLALAEELLHAALDLGILEGFWEAAHEHITTRTRPWQGQSLARATDDPHLQRRYGEYTATVHAAQGLLDEAIAAASDGAALPSAVEAVAASRAFVSLACRTVISGTIELLGAGATSGRFGFDLYWRDFTAHAVAHPPLWPVASLGRRLASSAIEETLA